jgi:hypothetical protein
MGKGSKRIEASSGNRFGNREAHHVGVSPEEDCGGAAGAVGASEGGEAEGCLGAKEPAARMRQAFTF